MPAQTFIGCEAYIVRGSKLLLGKRGQISGAGTWALPGGHLEPNERIIDGLIREVEEELGISISPPNAQLLAVTDDIGANKHYLHMTFMVDIGDQEPELVEPEACDEWRWFELDALPTPLFPPHIKIFKTVASGAVYRADRSV